MAQDVFISYSSKDKPVAEAICTSLETNGIGCWIAPRDILPGSTWGEAIVNAIRTSQVMVLVLSAQSNESAQVLREVERAVSKNVTILPFRIEDILPSPALEYYISSEHWLDALTPPLETHLKKLVEALSTRLARKEAPVITAPKKHNLPVQRTSFIGREKELGELNVLLLREDIQLVTLTGPGGTGKTRLALKAAEELLEAFPDGTYLVELAPLNDAGLVVGAVAATLGLRESPGRTIQQVVMDYLEHKQLLLILDNCEHLVEECARLADWLLKGSPGLKILATSREILGMSGETSLRVPPLELPDMQHLPELTQLGQVEAVRLFVERGRQASAGFGLAAENAAAVVQVCQRLDGIPLALELAAARLRMMTVQQVAGRLGDMFRILTGGSRSALPRQQTLKAAMDWSYALLTEAEKLALMRLSSFAGSWTLEGAEAVCPGDGIEEYEVLDLLGSLVDKSLAVLTGEGRYHMLETVRQYAHDRLLESGKGEEVRDRHLDYYLKLADAFAAEVRGKKQIEWLNRMEQELENLRLALDWALGRKIMDGLCLGSALLELWSLHSHAAEGAAWLEKLLTAEAEKRGAQRLAMGIQSNHALLAWVRAASAGINLGGFATNEQRKSLVMQAIDLCRAIGEPASQELAYALLVASQGIAYEPWNDGMQYVKECVQIARQKGYIVLLAKALLQIYYFTTEELENEIQDVRSLEESVALFRQLEDPHGIASCLFNLSWAARFQGDDAHAYALMTEVQGIYRQVGDLDALYGTSWWQLGVSHELGTKPQDYQLADHTLAYFRDKGNEGAVCWELIVYTETEFVSENYPHGEELGEEACRLSLKGEDQGNIAFSHAFLAMIKLAKGDLVSARQLLTFGSTRSGENLAPISYINILIAWMMLLSNEGNWTRVVKVSGAVDSKYRNSFNVLNPPTREQYKTIQISAREALGEEAFAQAFEEGQALTLWQALQLAMQA